MSVILRTDNFSVFLESDAMFVITGGGQGIGKALAHALAGRCQSVLIIGRHEQTLVQTASSSPFIRYLQADVSKPAGREQIVECLQDVTAISGLVHNAATIDPILPVLDIDEAAWHQCMATNIDAPFFLNQRLHDKLINGRVLNIGSAAAYFPVVGWTAYCVSKAALSMLTRCWQLESTQIAFASVMPGIIDTEMQAKIRHAEHMAPEKSDFFTQLKQDNRLVSPATAAAFICWLLLDIDKALYVSKEWDIYDDTHHSAWRLPPHEVPVVE